MQSVCAIARARRSGERTQGASCLAEIALASAERGFRDIGVDLIAGLPYQTADSWRESLETAVNAGLTHLSVYMLEVDEDSRLGLGGLAGRRRPVAIMRTECPAMRFRPALYAEQACGFLAGTEFAQYEISNLARAGRQSRHNRKCIGSGRLYFGVWAGCALDAADAGIRD